MIDILFIIVVGIFPVLLLELLFRIKQGRSQESAVRIREEILVAIREEERFRLRMREQEMELAILKDIAVGPIYKPMRRIALDE